MALVFKFPQRVLGKPEAHFSARCFGAWAKTGKREAAMRSYAGTFGWSLTAMLVAAAAWAGSGFFAAPVPEAHAQPTPLTAAPPPGPGGRVTPTSMGQLQLSFSDVVKRTAPAVVNVYTRKIVRRSPMLDDPFFRRFYGIPDQAARGPASRKVQNSLGSGVIVRSDGIVVTNNHVIEGADEIVVVLSDKREFDAKILLADDKTDLAVLKIDTAGKALPALRFHNSDDAQVGDIVLAIGNPFGVGQTVTSGIISALARTQVGVSDYQFFIQTDAAINPGNSGGALVTMNGDLIGINTAIFSKTGGNVGIGFAIPANMVKLVAASAESGGKQIARPWIGVDGQPVTSEIAESLGLDRPQGILLQDVPAASPLARAGLKQGDVVTKIDGFEVNDLQSLRYRMATKGVGKTAEIGYLRNGTATTAQVALVTAPDFPARAKTVVNGPNPFNGATVSNLNPAFAEELGISRTRGVVIAKVERRSLAARVGFRPGDFVLEVNGREINGLDVLNEQLQQRPRAWEIAVERGGQVRRVRLPPVR
jgi:Do/DeqQ family serine protease